MKNVAVFFGGKSCEHDVSVITGVLTLNSIDKDLYNPVPIYVTKEGEWLYGEDLFDVAFYKLNDFKKLKKVTFISGETSLYQKGKRLKKLFSIYSAINCMHGLNGEDGTLSGLLKSLGIALVGSGQFSSSASMDKEFTKIVLKGLKVNCLPSETLLKSEFLNDRENSLLKIEKAISYPVIIKPANLGSSIGISTAFSKPELISSLKTAFLYDQKVIVEPYLSDFSEYNCAVYKCDQKVTLSDIEKPSKSDKILTFDDKYQNYSGLAEREFPAKIPKALETKILKTTEKVYTKCGFSGIIRIDYVYHDNNLYLNEINTVPGSMAYYLFCSSLKDFTVILSKLIEESVKEMNAYNSNVFSYSSSVLKIDGAKGSKRLTRKN